MDLPAELSNEVSLMRFCIPAIAIALAVLAGLPHATAEDMRLRYITLFNNGGYNVDPIELHWKTPHGVKDSKSLGAKIEAGESKNCRKDRKHIYAATSSKIWWLGMAGTTLNNNRCQNVSKKNQTYPPNISIKGNSSACD